MTFSGVKAAIESGTNDLDNFDELARAQLNNTFWSSYVVLCLSMNRVHMLIEFF